MHRARIWLALLLVPAIAAAQQGDGTDVAIAAHVYKPARVDATEARMATLRVPEGFAIAPFATRLGNPRIIAVSPAGHVYVSRREQGDVVLLADRDGDGRADSGPRVVLSRPNAHGLAIHDGHLYVATVKEIFVAPIADDGSLGEARMIVGDLADGGQHPNRTLFFGPDDMLYVTSGSTCNACNETNPENATVLRMSPDGKSRTIFASGLRNTIGMDWHPRTGELWGLDHGTDYLGDDAQPEELNLLQQGRKYGWPHVHGAGDIHPQTTPPGGITKEAWKAGSVPMVLGYTAHAAPMQMLFYRGGAFPAAYRGDAFATMRGSWNRKPASGYEVVRIRYRDGRPQGFEPFVTGFLSDGGTTHFARPVGLAELGDGSLLVGDDANGVIYRVASTGAPARTAAGTASPRAPAAAMERMAKQGVGVPLALARKETRSSAQSPAITVTSTAFAAGGDIPVKHSEYADGVSPALEWTAVEGVKSWLLVMEDPDAKPITPFVHWVAWNIPATVTRLPEGLQEQPRLTLPEGVLQGATSYGAPGYFGPKPPVGDPDHHYHFQVFALDTILDVPAGANRDEVLAAARGHVIAKGELVGRYRQTVKPLK